MNQSDYSRVATRDVRSAMAAALADKLAQLEFYNPNPFRFHAVFDEWPRYMDKFLSPSACVLPGSWRYADALMTPTLCEDTIEPLNPDGTMAGAGFALYKLSEVEVDLEVSLRASSTAEREAIILGMEQTFRAPNLLMDEAAGPRYGVVLPLPDYFGVSARFALMGARVIDDEDRAMREQRDAVFTVSAQAPQVTVGPVFPLNMKTRLVVGQPTDPALDC